MDLGACWTRLRQTARRWAQARRRRNEEHMRLAAASVQREIHDAYTRLGPPPGYDEGD